MHKGPQGASGTATTVRGIATAGMLTTEGTLARPEHQLQQGYLPQEGYKLNEVH